MIWEILVTFCTLASGLAATFAVYEFTEKHTPHQLKTLPARFKQSIYLLITTKRQSTRFIICSSHSLSFFPTIQWGQQQISWEQPGTGDRPDWGTLIVYAKDCRAGYQVHVCAVTCKRYRNLIVPTKSVRVKHHIRTRPARRVCCSAKLDLSPGYYVVWIGKAKLRLLFKRPTIVPVFSGQVTELFLR